LKAQPGSGEAADVMQAELGDEAAFVRPTRAVPGARIGMIALVSAQFLSTVADTALLFVALMVLARHHYPAWAAPLLQTFFVAAFTLLAPFVGPFADSMPKGRVMLLANLLKLAGSLAMLAGVSPFIAYGLAGIGAAAYSPAKFGILAELVPPSQLVQVNAVVEAASFLASLAGTIAGGMLADQGFGGEAQLVSAGSGWPALAAVSGIYAASGIANLFIPPLPAAQPRMRTSLRGLLGDFGDTVLQIYRMPDARFALLGSSLFTGAGATLRLMLIAWVPVALGSSHLLLPAYLSATAVLGIVAGAALASRLVRLESVERVLPAGALIGLALMGLAGVTRAPTAFAVLATIGAAAGFFLVPLNALLQARGRETVGAGHAVAVQNLTENTLMMIMLGLYTGVLAAGVPVATIAAGFGALILAIVAGLRLQLPRVHTTTPPP
jgi:LPLT family lysophospholipid transporter-like MFS transporter